MNKAFVREDVEPIEDDEGIEPQLLPAGGKNYMTPAGFSSLQAELERLIVIDRPEVVNIVSWAAGNGDRSENGDYIYGKKRLREIDRRIRYLNKRLATAVVADPTIHAGKEVVFFGARVTVVGQDDFERSYRIVGVDEAEVDKGDISWVSPLARALLGKSLGDEVTVVLPGGVEKIDIVAVEY